MALSTPRLATLILLGATVALYLTYLSRPYSSSDKIPSERRAILQRPKQAPAGRDGPGLALSRMPLYDTEWGRLAVEALKAWRSSLFLRVAEFYTWEEKAESNHGLKPIGRVEPLGHKRYDFAQPFLSCPHGNLSRTGEEADGGKWLCMDDMFNKPGCTIYSLGSNGQFGFEAAMLNATSCAVHTFDCTYDNKGKTLHPERHFYHKVCLAKESKNITQGNGDVWQYLSYSDLSKRLGSRRASLLKIDIEGFEFDALSSWSEDQGCTLPLQIAIEIHYSSIYFAAGKRLDFTNLFWSGHEMSLGELALWFSHFSNLGYGIVSREDNENGGCCAEYTLLKVEQPGNCAALPAAKA